MHKIPGSINQKKPGRSNKATALATEHSLRHLAFDNTAQANIITTVSSGKIIMANIAARKLLGYSKKELLTKNRSAIFNIKEISFKRMLKQRTHEGHSAALVTVHKKSGKPLTCEITSSVFIDEDGFEKAITTIADTSQSILKQRNIDTKKEKIVADNIAVAKSKQKKIDIKKEKIVANNIGLAKSKQKKIDIKKEKAVADDIILAQAKSAAALLENNQWIKYIAKASYDVMWDWDIATGQVYIGDSIDEVFGYKLEKNTINFSDLKEDLLVDKKNTVVKNLKRVLASSKKNWADSFKIKRHDGSVACVTSRASIIRDMDGKAIRLIGATQDVSRLREMEDKLEKQIIIHEDDSEKFRLAAKLSFDVIWEWDILTNEVFLGDGFEELFGYKIKNNKGDMIADWVNYLHPDDRETVIEELQNSIRSSATHWEHAYRVSRADSSIAKVFVRASIIRHADGKAYRMIGAIQDLSQQNELEEKLEFEIKLKEKQITEATEDAKNMERSDIGKELHDNVNQLLSASRMYLEMGKRGGENSKMYLSRSSEYTISAIEEIRKLSKGLATDFIKNLGLCDAIDILASDTMEANPVKISCALESFKENTVNDKFKLNLYRIIQEELNNILKHAKATEVTISLLQNKKFIILSVADNGIGFDTGKKQIGIGIGIANIKSRVASFNGIADFVSQPGRGCVLTAKFPVTNALLNIN